MGIFNRLKRGAGRVKNGLKHIHEEARYPGRPASYQATDNPLWADKDVVKVTTGQEPAPGVVSTESSVSASSPDIDSRTSRPWFLEGDQADDGWDGTNPGEEWSADKPQKGDPEA